MKHRLLKSMVLFLSCVFTMLHFADSGYTQEEEVSKFPSRAITFIYPYPPGTSPELATRLICKEAEKFLGKPIVVLNKSGGAGAIGTSAIATSKADGYTIGYTAQGPTITVPLLENIPYHPLKDFKYIMQFAGFNMGIVIKADSPFKGFNDLIEHARQNPKKMTYGTVGVNSTADLLVKRIAKKEGVKLTHIPFKGTTDLQSAILGGHLIFMAGDFNYSLLEAEQLRLLLLFREEKAVEYPQTPILKELGYNFPVPTFNVVVAPRGVPDGVVKQLEEAFTKAMKEPAFIKGIKELRLPIIYRDGKELTEYITYNYNYFAKLLKELDLKE